MNHDQETFYAVLRNDFSSFLEKVFMELNPGTPFLRNWHIDMLADRLERARVGDLRRLIINQPPRMLKSTIASIAWPAFILGHDPTTRIIVVSYSQSLGSDLSRSFRRVVESDWYKSAFPGMHLTKITDELIETSSGGSRRATSIDGSLTGLGGNYLIVDDPMSAAASSSETEREKVKRFFEQSLFTRLNDKLDGRIVIVMQRLHSDDLSGHLLARDPNGWTHICLPAIATNDEVIDIDSKHQYHRLNGSVLHQEREPMEALNEAKRNLGSIQFEAQYQQAPIPDKGNLILREWFKIYNGPIDCSAGKIVQSWDTAFKDDPSCDWSVCTTWYSKNGNHYLIDVYRKQRIFPDLLRDAVTLNTKYNPNAVLIEDQGTGTTMIQTLRTDAGIPAIGRRSKDSKQTRLVSVQPQIEAGTVFLPDQATWLGAFLNELCGFPANRHDDQVDSVSQYLIWARERALSSKFEFDFGHDEPIDQGCPYPDWIIAMRHK